MKGIDNKRKEALTGGSILPEGCCPFVVTGNDGDSPVVLVFVVTLCSWFDAFVIWCTTTSLDKGRGKRQGGVGCPRSRLQGLSWRVILVIFPVFSVRSCSRSCLLAL